MTWYDCLRESGCACAMVRAKGYFFHQGRLWEVVADAGTPYHVTDALRNRDRARFEDLDWGDIEWESMKGVKTKPRSEIMRLAALDRQRTGPSSLYDLGRLKRKLIADRRYEDAAMVVAVEMMAEQEGML